MSICSFCDGPVGENDVKKDNYAQCTKCLTPCHYECFKENNHLCMQMGCGGTGVYHTPQSTTLPAKQEPQTRTLANLVEDTTETTLPSTQFTAQEDRLDELIKTYSRNKGTLQGGTTECVQSVYAYHWGLHPNKAVHETMGKFLEEYTNLTAELENITHETNDTPFGFLDFSSPVLIGFTAVSLGSGNLPFAFVCGTLAIGSYGVKKFLNDKRTMELRRLQEEKKSRGLKDLRQKYAPRLYLAETGK